MATLAASMTALSKELMTAFGQTTTLKSFVSEEYTPGTGMAIIYASTVLNSVIESYKAIETIGRVQADDIKVTVENAGVEPSIKDKLTIDTVDYDVVHVEKTTLQGEVVIYTLQVRL